MSDDNLLLVDPLTGAYSRGFLKLQLQQELQRALRYHEPFSLLVLDLDHFKSINDAFGHSRGDQVLVDFVQRLKGLVRSSDYIFRYGGDEFLLLLPNTAKTPAAKQARRILEATKQTAFSGLPPVNLSLSIGLASCPEDAHTVEGLFEKADQRAYLAKRQGRGRVIIQDASVLPTLQIEAPDRLIERELALKKFQVFLDKLTTTTKAERLVVRGERGSGISRFLQESGRLAQLRGFGLLSLRGNYALKNRYFGVINQALLALPGFERTNFNKAGLVNSLKEWVSARGYSGLIITIDGLGRLDRASQEFLQYLLSYPAFPGLGLVYGSSEELTLADELEAGPALELAPVSAQGLRVWLRHSLRWEAPDELVEWFYSQTGGLPLKIQRGLEWLVSGKLLQMSEDGWELHPDYSSVALSKQLDQLATVPHNLPEGLPEIVGREAALSEIHKNLKFSQLVTLVGPGGIGKTRLALQAGAELLESFRHGVYLVSLAGIENPGFIIPAITEALKLKLRGSQPALDQLINYLQGKEILLILDNFEQLLDGSRRLAELLEKAPLLRLLVTSRERLNLFGEKMLTLNGLDFPLTLDNPDYEAYSAVQLFLHVARNGHQPEFSLSLQDREGLIRLCKLVDGMPLGLELAAAWVESVPLAQIVGELERNTGFSVKRNGRKNKASGSEKPPEREARHQSLQTTLDWFWQRMSGSEQKVLMKLTVFRGGFKDDAARQVAGASPFFLDGLVAKAFLTRSPERRYYLHELLRQYAEQQASERELNLSRSRHSRYYVGLLRRKAQALSVGRRLELEEVTSELENVRAAWHWAVANRQCPLINQSARGLSRYFAYKGFNDEGEQAITEGIKCLRKLPQTSQVQIALARLMVELAYFLKERANFNELSRIAGEAFELARQTEQPKLQAESLLRWGSGLMWQGERAKAHELFERGLALSQVLHFSLIEADILRSLGLLYDMNANFPLSIAYANRALVLSRKINYKIGECATLANLGEAYLQQGEYDKARLHLEPALALAREIQFRLVETNASECLGKLWMFAGDYAQSKTYLENALALAHETGNLRLATDCLTSLGLLLHLLNDNLASYNYDLQALKIVIEQGNRQYEAYTLTYLGHALTELGQWDTARKYYQAAVAIRREMEQPGKATEPLAGLVRLALKQANPAEALAYAEEILRYLESGGHLNGVSEPLRVYLTCYQALAAVDDSRAGTVLAESCRELEKRANLIADPQLRRTFLENIAVHRQIIELSRLAAQRTSAL